VAALVALLRFGALEFGPLAAFLILAATLGVKAAIAGSIAAILLDGAWRWRRAPFTRLYVAASGLTLLFGAIDLVSSAPFTLKFEAPLVNLATAAAFALFYGFGWVWADLIGRFEPRQLEAFWPTLFPFGFALAGLWFAVVFLVIGLGGAALIVAAYFWSGAWFELFIALAVGGGFIASGLLMRRP